MQRRAQRVTCNMARAHATPPCMSSKRPAPARGGTQDDGMTRSDQILMSEASAHLACFNMYNSDPSYESSWPDEAPLLTRILAI